MYWSEHVETGHVTNDQCTPYKDQLVHLTAVPVRPLTFHLTPVCMFLLR